MLKVRGMIAGTIVSYHGVGPEVEKFPSYRCRGVHVLLDRVTYHQDGN